jgi:polysaccharide biosynthesis/export protein
MDALFDMSRLTGWYTIPLRGIASCVGIIACAFSLNSPALADYHINPGDVLEFLPVRAPELRTKVSVDADGMIALPLIGDVDAGGRSIAEVRAKVQDLMANRVYRRRTEDGREIPIVLSPDEISVSIAEYRPVYLNGDVSKPGEQTYRPGLTVRQAVAIAGGYDTVRLRMNNPFLEQADLLSQYNSLWAQMEKETAVYVRLQAERDNKMSLEFVGPIKASLSSEAGSEIADLEKERFTARNAMRDGQEHYLDEAIRKEDNRVSALAEQKKKADEGDALDAQELARLQDYLKRGLTTTARVLDAKRATLRSRSAENVDLQAQVERVRDELANKQEMLDHERKIGIVNDLEEAQVKLAGLHSQVEAVKEKLAYVGMVRSQLTNGAGARPDIAIVRKTYNGVERMKGDEESEVLPGDVVEIALKIPEPIGSPVGYRGAGATDDNVEGSIDRASTSGTRPDYSSPSIRNTFDATGMLDKINLK